MPRLQSLSKGEPRTERNEVLGGFYYNPEAKWRCAWVAVAQQAMSAYTLPALVDCGGEPVLGRDRQSCRRPHTAIAVSRSSCLRLLFSPLQNFDWLTADLNIVRLSPLRFRMLGPDPRNFPSAWRDTCARLGTPCGGPTLLRAPWYHNYTYGHAKAFVS